jgi:phospholipase C
MHRALFEWQGKDDCGPDVTGLLELTPIGNHQVMARRRFSTPYDVWSVSETGEIAPAPVPVIEPEGAFTAGFVFLPGLPGSSGSEPRMLLYDPAHVEWSLYSIATPILPYTEVLRAPQQGTWPPNSFRANIKGTAGHQLIGLDDRHLLDRDLGDGRTRIWQITPTGTGTSVIQLVTSLVGGPRVEFRRGHRVVPLLGTGRLLEWLPRACDATQAPDGICLGADYRVWRTTLDAGGGAREPIDAQPESSGVWNGIGPGDDIVADEANLFVWTRRTGLLRSFPLDPALIEADPPASLGEQMQPALQSRDWDPPTTAPNIKHIVVIVQDGRSFDSYFGRYCTFVGAQPGDIPKCDGGQTGPACCEAMPASIPGAAACAPIWSADTDKYKPTAETECMRRKIADGKMTGFTTPAPDGCGNPLDFACAGPDDADGTPAAYWRLAANGALADRFFQTYAYADGDPVTLDVNAENLIYMTTLRFGDSDAFNDTPLVEKELARVQVPWAIYAGPHSLPLVTFFGITQFHDPDWSPFRELDAGELESDLATGSLPSVALVLPDPGDGATSELPGHSPHDAILYTEGLIRAIAGSPVYKGNTLVLLTYLTAGGYYDHIEPPKPLDLGIDGSSSINAQSRTVYYGPRVPLLALGPFARHGTVSHTYLEMSSIGVFLEWNWLHGRLLKGVSETTDQRAYRDTVVNNIGSLIDPGAAGIEVPDGPL